MPIKLHYDKRKEILYCFCEESFSVQEFKSTMNTITQSDEYPPDIKTLWSFQKPDFSSISESFQRELISIRKNYPQRGSAKLAIIAPCDLGFGISRMYEAYSEIAEMQQNIRVFRNHVDGEKWLLNQPPLQ